MSVPELGFMSYSSWTHRDPSPPQPCFVAWDKPFCGVQPENSLMVSTVHKFQCQPKAWHSAKTQQTCLQPSQAESGLVSIWMGDSTISGSIDRYKTPKWWEGKTVLAQPWSVHSRSWALHIRGTATNRSFQRARKPEGNSFRKQLKDLWAFHYEKRHRNSSWAKWSLSCRDWDKSVVAEGKLEHSLIQGYWKDASEEFCEHLILELVRHLHGITMTGSITSTPW